ncbi:MAG TPA: ATP-dependent RNA helicase DbpA [Myxococcota bacterium]
MIDVTGFTALALAAPLVRAIEVLGFAAMTPVQEHALPPMLRGHDVIAQARTGSGKTVAFGVGLLSRVDAVPDVPVQALVLCPTRELAEQVSVELRKLARFLPSFRVLTLCGGVPVRTQIPSLQTAPHVLVGTPGRILDHLGRGTLALASLRVLVLDEADRMLDMGFADAIADVVAQTPRTRQTLLFSATFPAAIRALSKSLQRDPIEITVDQAPAEVAIEQLFYDVEPAQKIDALAALLAMHAPRSALVFCHTRNDVRDVTSALAQRGHAVQALHGELEQRERDEVLLQFMNGSAAVLVATDVAARGLDIKGLAAVIAYELPTDADTHLHRIGRTGRAGDKGLALTLVSRRERERLRAIEERGPIVWRDVDYACAHQTPRAAEMVTLLVDGGKRDKLRAGDLLGALTKDIGLSGDAIGKIDIGPVRTYVAVRTGHAAAALAGLNARPIKGRAFRVRKLHG